MERFEVSSYLYFTDSCSTVNTTTTTTPFLTPTTSHPIPQLLFVGRASVLPTLYSGQALLINHEHIPLKLGRA